MAAQFTREQMKACVAKMCLTVGWHTSMTTPIEILTDILCNYLFQLGKTTNEYANGFGMTEPNIDHLGLAFRDFHVNLSELEEYVKYVDFADSPTLVSKYPLPKEDHLNFLKPGSKEVVTRPVHIHEHLPPMNSILEASSENEIIENAVEKEVEDLTIDDMSNSASKRSSDSSQGDPFKRPRLLLEEEGRPTREISSVMMTTSGFLSPAREGKLPEARTPTAALEPSVSPGPPPLPAQTESIANKKPLKVVKRIEKKKDKLGRDLFKPFMDNPTKKSTTTKDSVKSKMKSSLNTANSSSGTNSNISITNDLKPLPIQNNNSSSKLSSPNQTKFNKALAAARLKTEKLNTTITPISPKPTIPTLPLPQKPKIEPYIDKLFTEPDKRKINILKKISVKNEKLEKVLKVKDEVVKQDSKESSPDLIIDEGTSEVSNKVHHLSNDITIELVHPAPFNKNIDKAEPRPFYDDDSPPGTPSTPKTPELISQSPPLNKVERRKRKDKSKIKKLQRQASAIRLTQEMNDIDVERPKTPEAAHVIVKPDKPEFPPITPPMPFPFFTPFGGPGLIPSHLGNPLFTHLPIPPLNIPTFGQPPYISPVHPGMPINFIPPLKQEEVTRPVVEKPSPLPSQPVHTPVPTEKDTPSIKLEKKNKEHKKDKKDKLKKKNKKDKVKNKAEKKRLKEEKKDKEKIKKEKKEKRKEKEIRENEISVPKLTLKLGSASPHTDSSDERRKLNIKPIIKKEEEPIGGAESKREMSPELAKISALVTGQPKPKSTSHANLTSTDTFPTSSNDSFHMKKSMFKLIPKLRKKEIRTEPTYDVDFYNTTPSSYIDDTFNEDAGPSQTIVSPRVGPGPGRPRIHPIKPKPVKINKPQQQAMVKDAEGNTVWICPACSKQDDGSPMIGCDDCDAWYHWVCVGIQVPPDDNEDWYCRLCISKKQEVLQTDKKKKRKKREKKEH